MAVSVITHSEICASTAGKLGKDYTAESVGKTVQQYADNMLDLMKEKAPNNPSDELLVETPLVAYKTTYHQNSTKKNPDGTVTDVGPRRKVTTSVPNAILKGINADLIKLVVDIVGAVVGKKAA